MDESMKEYTRNPAMNSGKIPQILLDEILAGIPVELLEESLLESMESSGIPEQYI